MHSYISNSKDRRVKGPWGKTWILSMVLVLGMLGLGESVFRWNGHEPSIIDNISLWAWSRDQVYGKEGKTPVVLLGASRMQIGFVPEVLEEKFPEYEVVQLAIEGRVSSYSILLIF